MYIIISVFVVCVFFFCWMFFYFILYKGIWRWRIKFKIQLYVYPSVREMLVRKMYIKIMMFLITDKIIYKMLCSDVYIPCYYKI